MDIFIHNISWYHVVWPLWLMLVPIIIIQGSQSCTSCSHAVLACFCTQWPLMTGLLGQGWVGSSGRPDWLSDRSTKKRGTRTRSNQTIAHLFVIVCHYERKLEVAYNISIINKLYWDVWIFKYNTVITKTRLVQQTAKSGCCQHI